MDFQVEEERISLMVKEKLFESSIAPILLCVLFLVLLYFTKSQYSITARVQFAILAMFIFLMCLINEPTKMLGFYRDMVEYRISIYAICGLGFSLFAFRQFGFKRFDEVSRSTMVLWAFFTGMLLITFLSGVFHLIR